MAVCVFLFLKNWFFCSIKFSLPSFRSLCSRVEFRDLLEISDLSENKNDFLGFEDDDTLSTSGFLGFKMA